MATRSAFATWSSSTIPSADPAAITGILGGTFDPVHRGHLAAAAQLRVVAGLSEVWLMPNARPPHRVGAPLASPRDRLRMVELATRGVEGIEASSLEVDRGGTSYTIDTVRQLRALAPDRAIALLLGFDAALQIRSWHESDALLSEARFVIFSRPRVELGPGDVEGLGFAPARTRVVLIETPAISARTVRARLRTGQPVEDMLSPEVLAYIREHGLYPRRGRMG